MLSRHTWALLIGAGALLVTAFAMVRFFHSAFANGTFEIDSYFAEENDVTPPPPVPVAPQQLNAQPSDKSGLGGYDVLIADRGNNRVIEVTPDKRIVWEYDFKGLPPGYGADDSFFADGGSKVIVNLEYYHLIEIIDYRTKQVLWQYGVPGMHGSGAGYLYRPDDAYLLPNGDVIVADIQNCRVLEISPQKKIVHRYGVTRQCSAKPGFLDAPNGDTPLKNGDVLISTILNHSIVELNPSGQPVFSLSLPIKYPSDPQPTRAGNILVASYINPGKIIEITRQGNVVWEFDGVGTTTLNRPSLAIELSDGNVLTNDDFNHRVIVIDKNTKQILWQYGVTGKPGSAPGQLNIPDGLDIIHRDSTNPAPSSVSVATIGAVTRHASQYLGLQVSFHGYLLAIKSGYALFSDEPGGAVGRYDLPVTGLSTDALTVGRQYRLSGDFVESTESTPNGNPDVLKATEVSPY